MASEIFWAVWPLLRYAPGQSIVLRYLREYSSRHPTWWRATAFHGNIHNIYTIAVSRFAQTPFPHHERAWPNQFSTNVLNKAAGYGPIFPDDFRRLPPPPIETANGRRICVFTCFFFFLPRYPTRPHNRVSHGNSKPFKTFIRERMFSKCFRAMAGRRARKINICPKRFRPKENTRLRFPVNKYCDYYCWYPL